MSALRQAARRLPLNPSAPSPAALTNLIDSFKSVDPTPTTVRDLYNHGRLARRDKSKGRITSAKWLHRELCVRLAGRVDQLRTLPLGLADMPSVMDVRDMYERSFSEIVECEVPESDSKEREFAQLLSSIRTRHDTVVLRIAKGVLEWKDMYGQAPTSEKIREFLDTFYMSRIGIRVLISHHLMLGAEGSPDRYGVINRLCKPSELAQHAIDHTRTLAYQHYGEAPEVEVRGNLDMRFPYVDNHLYVCLFELLKNSLRATVETHKDGILPKVLVIIADGEEDMSIKIGDEGGGISKSEVKNIWDYMFTTAKLSAAELINLEDSSSNHSGRPDPIAGFGYGLPLSRLYAWQWGGSLEIQSMQGYGTDSFLHLSKLGDKHENEMGLIPPKNGNSSTCVDKKE